MDAILVAVGTRNQLTKAAARDTAAMWRETTQRYPKAAFHISLSGYDEDPRELWELPEAARYVRWWARFAGMDDPATASHFLDPEGMTFLAVCGAFGEELQREALAVQKPPTPKQ
jgi:hypothetical protein